MTILFDSDVMDLIVEKVEMNGVYPKMFLMYPSIEIFNENKSNFLW